MDLRTSVEPEGKTTFDGDVDYCWPVWQGYFDDSFATSLESPPKSHAIGSPAPILSHNWSPASRSSSASFSTGGSTLSSPLTTPTPGQTGAETGRDGKVMKRKAQNRAAQRAHRERQRDRLKALHEKIEKLQERCKQLQARNQLFETTFQRFFKHGVALLGTKQAPDVAELEADDFLTDDEIDVGITPMNAFMDDVIACNSGKHTSGRKSNRL